MKTETSFNIGQQIWIIIESKARHLVINKIEINITKNETEIKYYLNKGDKGNYSCHITDEKFCFKTREDLINNL